MMMMMMTIAYKRLCTVCGIRTQHRLRSRLSSILFAQIVLQYTGDRQYNDTVCEQDIPGSYEHWNIWVKSNDAIVKWLIQRCRQWQQWFTEWTSERECPSSRKIQHCMLFRRRVFPVTFCGTRTTKRPRILKVEALQSKLCHPRRAGTLQWPRLYRSLTLCCATPAGGRRRAFSCHWYSYCTESEPLVVVCVYWQPMSPFPASCCL